MQPGERFDVMLDVAERLSQRDLSWDALDTLLKQFGYRTWSYDWLNEGDADAAGQRDYSLRVLDDEKVDDAVLSDLHSYLGGLTERVDLVKYAPWRTDGLKLFLSHSTKDKGVRLRGQHLSRERGHRGVRRPRTPSGWDRVGAVDRGRATDV